MHHPNCPVAVDPQNESCDCHNLNKEKGSLNKNDYIFDGFAHRGFDPTTDGWMNRIPNVEDFLSVRVATDILTLFDHLCDAKRKIWHLEQELALWKHLPK